MPAGPNPAARLLDHLEGNVIVRGYYRNDQRVNWTGMEETFGAEADLTPRLRYRCGDFEFIVDSEFWINQPYERNPLLDTPERRSYAAAFQVNQSEIGKLALVTKYYDWTFKIGKFDTPFGRAYYPIYTNPYLSTNQAMDQPYIRTEIIENRETGVRALQVGLFQRRHGPDERRRQHGYEFIQKPSSPASAWSPNAGPSAPRRKRKTATDRRLSRNSAPITA